MDGARKPRSGLGRFVAVPIGIVVALAALWVAGLAGFATTIPDKPEDSIGKTDAIVVLTGGKGRIEEGVSLLREGQAKALFVSGVEPGVEVPEMLKRAHLPPAASDSAIVLGHDADNTSANALETADWMRAQGFHSLRLVTSAYHMPRSLLEFSHAMPDIAIVPHPVFPESVKQARWWAWPGTAHLIASEYVKYTLAWISLALLAEEGPR